MKKTPKQQNDRRLYFAVVPIVLFVLYVILDYFNVPYLLGLSINRINMDIFSTLLNSVVVVVLYIFTYHIVDKRQIQKDTNARRTADVLLLDTYRECLENLSIVAKNEIVEQYIVPKFDVNIGIEENKVISNFKNGPFTAKEEILDLSKGGYVEKEILDRYLHIQKDYKYVVTMKIVYSDLTDPQTPKQKELYDRISSKNKALVNLLNKEINRLEAIT